MASLIWLNIKVCGRLIDYPSANISPNKPYNNQYGDRAVIAKGNVIEGITAKW